MNITEIERDKTGWIIMPCGSLWIEYRHALAEHVPYCATCAGQIEHECGNVRPEGESNG